MAKPFDQRVVPMRLFATWEVDRNSSNCVPRLSTMTVNRLFILKPLEPDLTSIVFAIKMQGNKRTLRSNDIIIQPRSGATTLDIDLDISVTLQYPHFVKKKNNVMYLMIQRKKKYKNRPILGYKTLAIGSINMTEVLQRCADRDLSLFSEAKEDFPPQVVARVHLVSVGSQPIEQEETPKVRENDQMFTDEEDEESTNEDNSDSEAIEDPDERRAHRRLRGTGTRGLKLPPGLSARGNLKQKFVSLLKKFKVTEEDGVVEDEETLNKPTEQEIEELFKELDDLSPDSGPEMDNMDTISVKSTPKPGLRPYFANSTTSSREVLPPMTESFAGVGDSRDSDSFEDMDNVTEDSATLMGVKRDSNAQKIQQQQGSGQDTPPMSHVKETVKAAVSTPPSSTAGLERKKKFSRGAYSADAGGEVKLVSVTSLAQVTPSTSVITTTATTSQSGANKSQFCSKDLSLVIAHKLVSEQITTVFPSDGMSLPPIVLLVSVPDIRCPKLITSIQQKYPACILMSSIVDVRTILNCIVGRIQKFCNSNNVTPVINKLALIGGDKFLSRSLRVYTEVLAQKPSGLLQHLRFYVVSPNGGSCISRYLCSVDSNYAGLFNDAVWRECWERLDMSQADTTEVTSRIGKYLQSAQSSHAFPLAEAMLQCRTTGAGEEQSQLFVPFVLDVRIGGSESLSACDTPVTEAPASGGPIGTGSSPPSSAGLNQISPPSSPRAGEKHSVPAMSAVPQQSSEAVELQIDYWSSVANPSQTPGGVGGVAQRVGGELSGSPSNGGLSVPPGSGSLPGSAGKRDVSGATKYSLKTAFRSLIVAKTLTEPQLITPGIGVMGASLTLYFSREKRLQAQKMLQKLGMKNKEKPGDLEQRSTVIGVSRLICSAKTHTTIKVIIDGVEWTNVKFFQIAAQWQTQVKTFPVALFHFENLPVV